MRLTQEMRSDILKKAMGDTNKAFQKRIDDLRKREHSAAMKCYNSIFAPALRAKVNALPDEWLRIDDCLRFNVNGMDIRLTVKERVRVPSKEYHCHRLGVITGELADEVMSVMQDKQKMEEEHRQISAKLSALLDNCYSIKVLEATWPEGKPFYDYLVKASKEQKAGLPAVLISDINSALGLGKTA
jgi:hypothetical protein